ncbi:MAG: methylmalonyl Co-A mutase-associated GTPase MeaB [bacterium]|nr:methylmalonyl Co-A mutase-associated GTPase MeaB [bacterium]
MKFKTAKDYIHGILDKNKIALSKAITLIESTLPEHQKMSQEILTGIMPYTGKSIRLGITGVPGVGKSTFIEAIGIHVAKQNNKVAVLAIDPSSSVSGGSILADKTRMEQLAACSNAFIRPSPSSTYLGGVAQKTRETMLLCEAAGFDTILIETVGVGQSETTVASMVDFFLVLMLPNAGDELQGIKKGVLELADAIVINKADEKNSQQALLAKKIYENAMHILTPTSNNWSPPVLTCSALEFTGIAEIWNMIKNHNEIFNKTGELKARRQDQSVSWMWTMLEDNLNMYLFNIPEVKDYIKEIKHDVKNNNISPTRAARKIFKKVINHVKI